MVQIPSIDIPTAIVAAVVAVLAHSGKEWIQRLWGDRRASVQTEIRWLEGTIEQCNRLLMMVSTQQTLLNAYDELDTYDGYAGDVLKDMNLADVEHQFGIGDDDWEDLGEYEEMEKWVVGQFHKHREAAKQAQQKKFSDEIDSLCDNLVSHYCERHFTVDESVKSAYSRILTQSLIQTMYSGLSDDGSEELSESAEELIEACEGAIDKREGLTGLKYCFI